MTSQQRTAILLAAGGSLALLAGAFIFQAFGYAPCKLCIWQRWPHVAAIVIGVLCLATRRAGLAWFGALAALATAGVGLYHTGVERGFWVGPTTCTSGDVGGLSADDLMNQILAAPLIRCDEVAWQLLGLSMASWNAILSLGLAAIWVWAATRRA
ncbi:disulfide bond formation protein B [Frigidibacter sp. RF13]|uniref:disulfide bond formation protein B n=1 Tax=Frigidibacter sp. RF13 TaxID=2997340 RepID=UPI00226DAEFA|nr:disulfide bond formation protein B [Frigidibacter sp. RF13]MCY1125412.1 disulfide bond formation protein B [Frigidibacter sp. RF13]